MIIPKIPEPKLISLLPDSQPSSALSSTAIETPEFRQLRIEEFLDARSLAPNSRKAYREDLQRFIHWTDTPWAAVTTRQVTQFKAYLLRSDDLTGKRALSDASARRILQTLKNFLNWMTQSGYIDRNPTHTVHLPKLEEPEANHLTDEQMEAIVQAMMETSLPQRNMALLAILRHGLRAQEVSNLNMGDFDGQRLKIRQGKAGSKGTVPINRDAQSWIEQYLRDREYQGEVLTPESPLLVSHSNRNSGQRMGYHAIQKLMKSISKTIGFDFHAHQFRHTFATNLVLKGMNPYHVMTLTRHKSAHSFRRYTKAADDLAAEQAFRQLNH
jgi:integrase/recombinase XerD